MTGANSAESQSERGKRLAMERRAARLAAVQALYQIEIGGGKPEAIIREFTDHRIGKSVDGVDLPPADRKLFSSVVLGASANLKDLDDMIAGVLTEDWSVERLESILRAVLRCGAYELAHRPDIPPKVTISEYIAVSDAFLGDKETGLANGVLDQLAHALRPDDMGVGEKDPNGAGRTSPSR